MKLEEIKRDEELAAIKKAQRIEWLRQQELKQEQVNLMKKFSENQVSKNDQNFKNGYL